MRDFLLRGVCQHWRRLFDRNPYDVELACVFFVTLHLLLANQRYQKVMFIAHIVSAVKIKLYYLVAKVGQNFQVAVTTLFGYFAQCGHLWIFVWFDVPLGQADLATTWTIEQ